MSIQDDIAAFGGDAAQSPIKADAADFRKISQEDYHNQLVKDQYVDTSAVPTPSDPMAHSISSVPEGQEARKKVPDFMKKIEILGTAAGKGSLMYAGNLLNWAEKKITGTSSVRNAQQYYDEHSKELDKNYETGALPAVGEFAGSMIGTPGLGKGFSLLNSGAKAVGAFVPQGLKTVAKYGTALAGGTLLGAGLESQKNDPANPDQVFNMDAASKAMENPVGGLLAAAGLKASVWGDASRKLQKAQEVMPSATAWNVKEPGASRKFQSEVFGMTGALTGLGHDIQQREQMGDTLYKFVQTMSDRPDLKYSKDLIGAATTQVQAAFKAMKQKENYLWEKGGLKDLPIVGDNVTGVMGDVQQVNKLLEEYGSKQATPVSKLIEGHLKDQELTVDTVKRIRTTISNAAKGVNKEFEGGTGGEIADKLKEIKDSLLTRIQNSIPEKDFEAFGMATQMSADNFAFKESSKVIRDAIKSEAGAKNFVENLISESGSLKKETGLGILSPQGKNLVAASKMADVIKASDTGGKLNIGRFLDKVKEDTQLPETIGPEHWKALQGVKPYLEAIQERAKVGWWRQAAIGAGVAGATGLGAMASGAGAVVPLIAYGAATLISNHSPLKTMLGALTKDLPDSTYNLLLDKITSKFTKAGYIMSQEGSLQHKDEDKPVEHK